MSIPDGINKDAGSCETGHSWWWILPAMSPHLVRASSGCSITTSDVEHVSAQIWYLILLLDKVVLQAFVVISLACCSLHLAIYAVTGHTASKQHNGAGAREGPLVALQRCPCTPYRTRLDKIMRSHSRRNTRTRSVHARMSRAHFPPFLP